MASALLPPVLSWGFMTQEKPEYSASKLNRVGKIITDAHASAEQMSEALIVMNRWRAAHAHERGKNEPNLQKHPAKTRRLSRMPRFLHLVCLRRSRHGSTFAANNVCATLVLHGFDALRRVCLEPCRSMLAKFEISRISTNTAFLY